MFSDILGKYIPDYQCILIQLKDYSNAKLMEKKDELALLMMIDKLRNVKDYEKMGKEVNGAFLNEVTENSPEYLLKLMAEVIGMFLSKLNIPPEEADTFTEQVKERKMGELFKHFEGWDVQALRQETKDTKEDGIHKLLNVMKKYHIPKKEAITQLVEEYHFSVEEAQEKIALYW